MTEALWKARPMVAGRVGGIVAQIQDGETGWLVDPLARGVRAGLPRDPRRPGRGAAAGAARARSTSAGNFLMPRLLRDWLVLFNRLAGNDTAGAEVTVAAAAG